MCAYVTLFVLVVGMVVAIVMYRRNPGPAQLAGIIGFALLALARLGWLFERPLVVELGGLRVESAMTSLSLALNLVSAAGLACVVYAYWRLASARA